MIRRPGNANLLIGFVENPIHDVASVYRVVKVIDPGVRAEDALPALVGDFGDGVGAWESRVVRGIECAGEVEIPY